MRSPLTCQTSSNAVRWQPLFCPGFIAGLSACFKTKLGLCISSHYHGHRWWHPHCVLCMSYLTPSSYQRHEERMLSASLFTDADIETYREQGTSPAEWWRQYFLWRPGSCHCACCLLSPPSPSEWRSSSRGLSCLSSLAPTSAFVLTSWCCNYLYSKVMQLDEP